jgi:hypothetical protein
MFVTSCLNSVSRMIPQETQAQVADLINKVKDFANKNHPYVFNTLVGCTVVGLCTHAAPLLGTHALKTRARAHKGFKACVP